MRNILKFHCRYTTVKGLGTLKIKGKGTVIYSIVDDNSQTVSLLIDNVFYVPSLNIRLIPLNK